MIGQPGEVKITYAKGGTKIEAKIGEDGRTVAEKHDSSAPNPKYHSNPHVNDWPDEDPNGASEFKLFGGIQVKYGLNSEADNRFRTISEFKECMIRGGEPVFMWNGVLYGVCFHKDGYCIAHLDGEYEGIYNTPDDVLEYVVGNDRLRDVITQVTVISRNI